MRIKRVLLLLGVFILLSCMLALAGGEAGKSEKAKPGKPIKIGVPGAFTGPYATDGLVCKQAVSFAVDEINSRGGILGRPLEMVFYDVEDVMPEKVMASSEALVMGEKVDLVITTWIDYGVDVKAYGRYDAPYFSGAASVLSLEAYQENPEQNFNYFEYMPIEFAYSTEGYPCIQKLPYKWPNKKLFSINEDDQWSHNIADKFLELAKADGWKVVGDETVPIGNVEWGGILTRIRAENPALLYMVGLVPNAEAALLKQFHKDPTDSIIYFAYVPAIPDWIELCGEYGNGVLWNQITYTYLDNPEAKEFYKAYTGKYGVEDWRIDYPGAIWDIMHMWEDAVIAVGDVTNYREIVKYIEDHPYEGLNGKYVFPKETHTVITGDEYIPVPFSQVQNEKHVLLYPEEHAEGTFIIPSYIR
jgi:ABC-type branched-subunit amino acid transport system substrate-binding protein